MRKENGPQVGIPEAASRDGRPRVRDGFSKLHSKPFPTGKVGKGFPLLPPLGSKAALFGEQRYGARTSLRVVS
jgi:hypothetical protein